MAYRIVGTSSCAYCAAAKTLLNECGKHYEEEVITMAEAKERGYQTVPQIWDGDTYIGGYTELHAKLSKLHMLF